MNVRFIQMNKILCTTDRKSWRFFAIIEIIAIFVNINKR